MRDLKRIGRERRESDFFGENRISSEKLSRCREVESPEVERLQEDRKLSDFSGGVQASGGIQLRTLKLRDLGQQQRQRLSGL